jgi:hypothetical protein
VISTTWVYPGGLAIVGGLVKRVLDIDSSLMMPLRGHHPRTRVIQ